MHKKPKQKIHNMKIYEKEVKYRTQFKMKMKKMINENISILTIICTSKQSLRQKPDTTVAMNVNECPPVTQFIL